MIAARVSFEERQIYEYISKKIKKDVYKLM